MGIFTNSKSIALPDLDTSIRVNLDEAITHNEKILDILFSSSTATGLAASVDSIQVVQNKLTQDVATKNPLPTFGVYSNYNNTPGYTCIDSDMQPIHGGILNTGTEIGQAFAGQNYTTSSQGSNTRTTNWAKATSMQQADGNYYVKLPSQPNSAGSSSEYGWGMNPNNLITRWPWFGTIIQQRGKRPNQSIYYNGSTVAMYPRGGMAPLEEVTVTSSTYYTPPSEFRPGYSSISYNKRTNTLALVQPINDANSYRLHVWKNANPNRDLDAFNYTVGTMHFFMSEAKAAGTPTSLSQTAYYYYNDFTWQASNSQNFNESRRKMHILMGDNNIVGLSRFVPNNITHFATFAPNFTETSGTLTALNGVSCATSYGFDNGNEYGMRYNHTWDNQWFVFYSVYAQYGSGMNAIYVNAADPSKYYVAQWASTSWGAQLVPYREDKFIFNAGDSNADGSVGMRLYCIDLGGALKNGRQANGAAIANGGNLSFFPQDAFSHSFDVRYTSTNYPIVVPMSEWTNG
jgi:hypothetical protein